MLHRRRPEVTLHHLCGQDGVVRVTPRRSGLGAGLDGLGEVDKCRSDAALDLLVVLLLMGMTGPGGVAGLAGAQGR